MIDFHGCTAIVAGGSSGLGLEMTKGLLSANCRVAIIGRTGTRVKSISKELYNKYNGNCHGFIADISNENSMKLFVKKVSSLYKKKVNIAINSAGIHIRNPITKTSIEEWEKIQKINLTGGFIFAKELFSLLCNAEFGRLINVTSIFSRRSFRDRASYSSSKGGLLQLTRTLAIEWAPQNITVNSISPGPFLTEMTKPVVEDRKKYKEMCQKIPLGRFGDPKEIVTACLFIASKDSSYITGADIIIDGGWTCM
jgi:NAD(P)-dependent dehydrogenase (short-subunit alcohol dehydrogenase family)